MIDFKFNRNVLEGVKDILKGEDVYFSEEEGVLTLFNSREDLVGIKKVMMPHLYDYTVNAYRHFVLPNLFIHMGLDLIRICPLDNRVTMREIVLHLFELIRYERETKLKLFQGIGCGIDKYNDNEFIFADFLECGNRLLVELTEICGEDGIIKVSGNVIRVRKFFADEE